ncbi:hypothetical protein EVAR_33744_1 [Eumeta japonica]|uniref:Uncharacterized protein n=1 Tax=Eumeta variegata TaxID=151549 RepID=A0A4C1VSS6_EUMVA|nr:hypothetical protein EVAR_33744_1 [Eumeta japonica]
MEMHGYDAWKIQNCIMFTTLGSMMKLCSPSASGKCAGAAGSYRRARRPPWPADNNPAIINVIYAHVKGHLNVMEVTRVAPDRLLRRIIHLLSALSAIPAAISRRRLPIKRRVGVSARLQNAREA